MDYKWIGAVLIVAGCGGFGFSMAWDFRREERSLRSLMRLLDYMSCELTYRMTPLPDLCRGAAGEVKGSLKGIFDALAASLEGHASPDVSGAMTRCLQNCPELPEKLRLLLTQLGSGLGRFDLEGQLKGIEGVRSAGRAALAEFNENRDVRLRNYQTLGLCAGAALAILLI